MPKKSDSNFDEETTAQPTAAAADTPVAEAAPLALSKVTARNTSATLVTLADGTPFPPNATAEISTEEAERWKDLIVIFGPEVK